jgi:ATP-dependent NAD(P)H-hydrate dehydratase
MKLVVDADGLNFMCSNTEALRNYSNAIITPNLVETRRLWDAFIAGEVYVEPNMPSVSTNKIFTDVLEVPVDEPEMIAATRLARVLGCTVCIKGPVDVISDGRRGILVNTLGSLKRAGGIGDVLSGTLAIAMFNGERNGVDFVEAAACASMIVRTASRFAYAEKGRSLTAVDVIDKMNQSLKHYID